MGFIVDFLIKLFGIRKLFTATLILLQTAFIASYFALAISLGVAVGKAYVALENILDPLFQSSLGGVVGGNDINAIAWSVIDSLGVIDVFETFIPIVFSTVVFYLSIYLMGIVLNFQKFVYRAIVDTGTIFLGS